MKPMQILQELFEAKIEESLSFSKIGTMLIQRRLEKMGITLNEKQLRRIERKLVALEGDSLNIQIQESQISQIGLKPDEQAEKIHHIEIKDIDNDLDDFVESFIENLGNAIPEIISTSSKTILDDLKRNSRRIIRSRRGQTKFFESSLNKVWGKALDLLELFIQIAQDAGAEFNTAFRADASASKDFVFEVLTRLHARACQISSEILTLLRSGHADGAHARWRTLHEIAVVGFFIEHHGSEVAERYLLHDAIESYKAAKIYQEYYSALGYEPLSTEEYDKTRKVYENLISQYGPSYKGEYGWASEALGNPKPNFIDIEKAVGLDHLRPFYKLASHNVHANPKGAFFKLGLYLEESNLLLAGPSIFGLADPGHGTAISLGQITTTLLVTRPNIDTLALSDILRRLELEIGEEFIKAHNSQEENQEG